MARGGRRCNPALGSRGLGEARLEPTALSGEAGPAGPNPVPGQSTPAGAGLPTPAVVPPQVAPSREDRGRRPGLVPGLSSYTKSETEEDGIEALRRRRGLIQH